jgi:hypothetical protein
LVPRSVLARFYDKTGRNRESLDLGFGIADFGFFEIGIFAVSISPLLTRGLVEGGELFVFNVQGIKVSASILDR